MKRIEANVMKNNVRNGKSNAYFVLFCITAIIPHEIKLYGIK
jgi:hypothetical protein